MLAPQRPPNQQTNQPTNPGGGTIYHTGFDYATAIGAFAFFGAGLTHVNGGGSLTYLGGSYAAFIITSIYAGIGGWVFQGSGSCTMIAVPQTRHVVTHNFVSGGLAGCMHSGAGSC